MLESIFSSEWIIREHRQGPLGNYSDVLAQELIEAGYRRADLRGRFGVISDLNRWLKRKGLELQDFSPAEIRAFIRHRKRKCRNIYDRDHATLQRLVRILRAGDAIPAEPTVNLWPKAIQPVLASFEEHLEKHKGFSGSGVKRYVTMAGRFLIECHQHNGARVATLTPSDVSWFLGQSASAGAQSMFRW